MSLQQVSQVGKLLFDKVDFNPVLNVIQNYSGFVVGYGVSIPIPSFNVGKW